MNYDEYLKWQIETSIVQHVPKYVEGERLAIDWFFSGIQKDKAILDVGCGVGEGMRYLRELGYSDLTGIELKPEKVQLCRDLGLTVIEGDVMQAEFAKKFDVIWSSHSFEHMYSPEVVLERLVEITFPEAQFFFVLPYPDAGDGRSHIGSFELGTRVDDLGWTVTDWFKQRGLESQVMKFSSFREPEIWLKFIKAGR